MEILICSQASDCKNVVKSYNQIECQENVVYKGVKYSKKMTYEKELSFIYRVFIGVIAFLSTITIIPYYLYEEKVVDFRRQAVYGVDQKIVYVKNHKKNEDLLPDHKMNAVRFGQARAREFDKDCAPNEISETSIVLENFESTNSSKPQQRKFPPISTVDTIIMPKGKGIQSIHGTANVFHDNEIVEKLDIIKSEKLGVVVGGFMDDQVVYAEYTTHGKAIIQQQATRGCTAAVTAMLIMDHNIIPNLTSLSSRNLGNEETMLMDIRKAGLTPLGGRANSLKELREKILKNGSCVTWITGREFGGHVVVVDDVSKDLSRVRLRDPYHGWEITVTSAAFLIVWTDQRTIVVE